MEQAPHPVTEQIKSTGCCPPFDPTPWQEKEITWINRQFVKDHVISFFHMPLNMGNKVLKNMKLIILAEAELPQQLMLTDEKSAWGADIYIDVSKEVPGTKMDTISGTFITKVFEGPYKDMGKWAQEMNDYVKSKNKTMNKLYFSYTTCPRCAKAYGKNYVILFAKIDN